MTISAFDKEVLHHLSRETWKTGRELTNEIGQSWQQQGRRKRFCAVVSLVSSDLAEVLAKPNPGPIYVSLYKLEEKGLVESYVYEHPRRKYRLTEAGQRLSAELQSR